MSLCLPLICYKNDKERLAYRNPFEELFVFIEKLTLRAILITDSGGWIPLENDLFRFTVGSQYNLPHLLAPADDNVSTR